MSQSCIVTDVHGAFYTLIRLLNQVATQHPGARLISLGDEIDRGPHSRAVVEFMMANEIPSVSSNHIDLCLAYSAHAKRGYKARCTRYYDRDVWLWNGGEEAFASWEPNQSEWRHGLPKEVLDWMAVRPPYMVLDTLDEQGRKCLASHTGYGLEADDEGWFGALWGRHPDDGPFPDDNLYRVHGHTRVREVVVGDKVTNIDSGAAYDGYRTLTAFIWPTKQLVQQAFDETPVEPTFTMVDGCLVPR
jgi:serine/threonine protein phosphatase 1